MNTPRLLLAIAATGFALAMPGASLRAALPNAPHEDIHFVAEHVAEAAQDTRYYALAWPSEPLAAGRWTLGISGGRGEARADFLEVTGELLSLHAFRGLGPKNGLGVQLYYDTFDFGGEAGEQVLRAPFAKGVPLDLPERIAVTNPRGTVRHFGFDLSWIHELSPAPERGWCLVLGVLGERLELDGFALDYRLLGGRDVGTRGVLDHSGETSFLTPHGGFLRRIPLGHGFELAPHVGAGVPLPPGDFDGRLTGPGFDLSSRGANGSPGKIGDGFVTLGATLRHVRSGLEIDLGSALGFPLFERATHPGVNRSLLLVVGWTLPGKAGGGSGQRSGRR